MVVSEEKEHNNDLLVFARENKEKFINVVKNEIRELRSVKVSFGLLEIQTMEHYFQEHEPHVFTRYDEDHIKIEFDRFVETMKGEIEARSARGSGWVLAIVRIMVAYVNVARYQPLRGGTYLDLPQKLKSKKAIINVQNRDNEVDAKSRFISTQRRKKLAKAKQISGW